MRKALHILGTLDEIDVEWLGREGSVQTIRPGTLLIEEGKCIDQMYLLLEGQLSVRVGAGEGTELANLYPGEIVGEISFVDSRPPSASVRAVRQSYVLALGRDLLNEKLQKDKSFAARFYRAIASFLADRLAVTVGRFGYGSPRQDNGEAADPDLLDDAKMEETSLALVRIDKLIRELRGDYRVRGAAAVL